jgi:phosphoribosylglycinamide formyltransferase-1
MNIALFAYNFPHKKTQDFLFRLVNFGFKPRVVIASPPLEINLPKSYLRDKYRHFDLILPQELCNILGIEYIERFHNDKEVSVILKSMNIELGIIAGARILKKHIIESVPLGIVNFHPGLLPENRGLNAVKWAIFLDIPQGMTVHLIDPRVDAGKIIKKFIVPTYIDDSLIEINLRIYESQLKTLIPVISSFIDTGAQNYYTIPYDLNLKHHPPADERIDEFIKSNFDLYKQRWGYDKNGWVCICGNKLMQDERNENMFFCPMCNKWYKESEGLLEFKIQI